jgi:hypothetical protein
VSGLLEEEFIGGNQRFTKGAPYPGWKFRIWQTRERLALLSID